MKRIHLTITAETPLAIGQRKPGASVSEAMDYIPGTVIRGAIAAHILNQTSDSPANGDDFHTLFLNDNAAVFQNAYPAVLKLSSDQYDVSQGEVKVLPATALSSKTNSGFQPKAGVFDALIDSFCAREHGHFYEPNDVNGDRVEPFKGFYSQHQGSYYAHSVNQRLLTRVGINRRRATAQEEILYSIKVLDEFQGKAQDGTPQPTVYKSAILIGDDNLATALQTFLEQNDPHFRLGGSTSRGLGKVHIKTQIEDVEKQSDSIKQRINEFNKKLEKRWDCWNAFSDSGSIEGRTFFTLDLQSDAILTENWRRTTVISEAMLSQFTNIHDPDLQLHMAYSSYDYRSGWNAAWGLQKDVELMTNMGSVYLFSTTQPGTWYKPLAQLESRGVGDRVSEGFGQIRVCDEFHLVFRERGV
jgi:CRISPR-associated protein Csx10